MHENRGRAVPAHLALEVLERHAQVVAVAVDELTGRPPAARIASGVAMKVFDGHSTVSPRTPAHSSAASAAPVQPLATASAPFQAAHAPRSARQLALGPALGVDHVVPERVQTRAVAMVEADREARELLGAGGQDARTLAGGILASSWSARRRTFSRCGEAGLVGVDDGLNAVAQTELA